MPTKRDYWRYALDEAALILDSAIDVGCQWRLDNDVNDFDNQEHIDAVTDAMKQLIAELERRSKNVKSPNELLSS